MKKFLANIALFVFPLIVLAYPVDYFINRQLKHSNTFAQKEYPVWNDVLEGKVNSDVVIYGSSRAWVHFDPVLIQDSLNVSAYNLGVDGQNFLLQNLRHKLLLKHNKKPKLIIHSVDIFTLDKRSDLYNGEQLLPYMLWNNEIKKTSAQFNGFNFWDFEIPLVRYYGKREAIKYALESIYRPQNNKPERIRGYQGQIASWNDDFDKALEQLGQFTVKLDSSTINLFKEYLTDCKANNISVIFVFTPEYIKGQEFVKNRSVAIELYKSLSKEFSIPFFDFSNSPLSYQKQYFYNSEHLNKTGAELFTNQLIDTIKKYDLIPLDSKS